MGIDFFAAFVILFIAIVGFLRGASKELSSITALLLGIFLSNPLAKAAIKATGAPEFISPLFLGISFIFIFFLGGALCGFLFDMAFPGKSKRILGAVIGMIKGFMVVFLVLWAVEFFLVFSVVDVSHLKNSFFFKTASKINFAKKSKKWEEWQKMILLKEISKKLENISPPQAAEIQKAFEKADFREVTDIIKNFPSISEEIKKITEEIE